MPPSSNSSSTTTSFSAAVATAPECTTLQEFSKPQADITSGLLRVAATGVCGSDAAYYQQLPASRGPLILGHETVGHVESLGKVAALKWGVAEGDLVALEEYLPCGHCSYCRSGDFRLCDATDWRLGGLRYGATALSVAPGLWGGFSQYQHLHLNTVFHKVASGVEPRHAALALPLSNGIEWTYLQGGAGPGQCVVIQGPGQQGLACIVAAREAGAAQIIVRGLGNATDEYRLSLARELGAHHTVNIESQDLLESVAAITGGHMADLVVDCAGGGTESVKTAMQLARKRGRVILAGQKRRKVAVLERTEIMYLFNLESQQAIGMRTYLGLRKPAFCTSEGRALLAFSSPAVVSRIVKKGLTPLTQKTTPSRLPCMSCWRQSTSKAMPWTTAKAKRACVAWLPPCGTRAER